ncbi:SsgA family sporulation/cell division regulator [Streptomyces sp. NPDC093982]|uniref:SsgA family sporulation/cell division regulator n=1 Tax=Streptomyces sp. NPDC093982 TaxID=3155077 RepID=UPI00341A5D23
MPDPKQRDIPTVDVTLKRPTRARLLAGDTQIPVPVIMRYVSTDPLAVHVDFLPHVYPNDKCMTWSFARDLLAEGLRAPAGIGDVRISPCGRLHTIMLLQTVEGQAMLRFETPVIRRFLEDSYMAVAPGREDMNSALEQSLGSLLDGV